MFRSRPASKPIIEYGLQTKFLTKHYAEILAEFQKIVDVKSATA